MVVAFKRVAAALVAAFLWGCSGGDVAGGGVNPPPQASTPTDLTGTAPNATSVQLNWRGSSRFTGYRVYRDDVEIANTTAPSYADSGLSPTTAYRYYVKGEMSSGLSGASNTVTVTTPNMLSLTRAELLDPTGRSDMMVRDIEFDAAGNIYITGGAFTSNFPTTPGAYDRTFARGGSSTGSAGDSDVFVMKVSRSGQLLWSTLIGGPNYDRAYGLAIAPDGGVVVAGRAGDGFPTTPGVVQPTFAGDSAGGGFYGEQDGFVAKLSADGSTLLWSTYFGDSNAGAVRDVATDGGGNVYLAGWFFRGLPHITANARQRTVNGTHDLVYARLSPNASLVEYATYLGGAEPPGAQSGTPSIIVAPNRNVYLAIEEGGSGAPTTSGAFQRSVAGGVDFFLARFDASDRLVYATYVGGTGDEDLETHNIAVDASGRVAIAGVSDSRDYPTSGFAYQAMFGGGANDGVVSILSADGSSLAASTYVGGGGREDIQGVEFAPSGLLYVAGGTRSSGLRTTSNAFRTNFAGVQDAFVAGFLSDLRGVPYLTYIGGSDDDIARTLAVAADGALATGGHTASFNFPVTPGGSTAPTGPVTGWWALFTP